MKLFRVFECSSDSLQWPVCKAHVSDQHEEVHQRDVRRLLPDPAGLSDVVAPTLKPGPASILMMDPISFKTNHV